MTDYMPGVSYYSMSKDWRELLENQDQKARIQKILEALDQDFGASLSQLKRFSPIGLTWEAVRDVHTPGEGGKA
jgi:hypothetical protein